MNFNLFNDRFFIFTGAKEVNNYKNIQDNADFYRYLSFQPQRNTLGFYQKALEYINEMDVTAEQETSIKHMLAGGTTGENHHPQTRTEDNELEIWNTVCDLIDNIRDKLPSLIRSRINAQHLKAEFITHITRLDVQPNMAFLESMAQHISHSIGNISAFGSAINIAMGKQPMPELVSLSDKLNEVIAKYQSDFYLGSRFYLVNRQWQKKMDIKQYTKLQASIPDDMRWIVPHLSTFTIRSKTDLGEVKDALKASNSIKDSAAFEFVMGIFKDAIQAVSKDKLQELIQQLNETRFDNQALTEEHYQQLLDMLAKRCSTSFPDNYFAQKKQQIIDAKFGLNAEQKALLDGYQFTNKQKEYIAQIESAMVRHNSHLVSLETLQQLNEKFAQLQELILPDEYTLFLKHLAAIREHHFASDELDALLHTLVQQKSLQSFNTIYFQQVIAPSTNGNLFKKCIAHMQSALHIYNKDLSTSAIVLHELMARLFLKLTPDNLHSIAKAQQSIKGFIDATIKLIGLCP